MDNEDMQTSNRLPHLAAEIRRAHADVQEAAKTAAERAIDAGHKLLEARELVKHGEWLPWLRENCALAERTAQLYMQLARKGVKPATVADLGLQAAANAIELEYGFFRPHIDSEEVARRDWWLFAIFMHEECGFPIWWQFDHFDWLGRHDFKSPEEWLGDEGRKFRATFRMGSAHAGSQLAQWSEFKRANADRQFAEIEAEVQRLAETDHETPSTATRKRRKRRRSIAA